MPYPQKKTASLRSAVSRPDSDSKPCGVKPVRRDGQHRTPAVLSPWVTGLREASQARPGQDVKTPICCSVDRCIDNRTRWYRWCLASVDEGYGASRLSAFTTASAGVSCSRISLILLTNCYLSSVLLRGSPGGVRATGRWSCRRRLLPEASANSLVPCVLGALGTDAPRMFEEAALADGSRDAENCRRGPVLGRTLKGPLLDSRPELFPTEPLGRGRTRQPWILCASTALRPPARRQLQYTAGFRDWMDPDNTG